MTIREELTRHLGRPVTEARWSKLENLGLVSDAEIRRDRGEEGYLDEMVEVFHAFTHPAAHGWREPSPPRRLAAAELWDRTDRAAERARREPAVIAFRREVLAGELLGLAEAAAWVRSQPGEPTVWSTSNGVYVRVLDFIEDGRHATQATRQGGPLERLRVLSADLADRHWWKPAQASMFVITDLPPRIPAVRWHLEMHGARAGAIRLDIAPGVPDKQVAAVYREAVAYWTSRRPTRRNPSEKDARRQIALSEFVASTPGLSWADRLVRWNASVEAGWQYASRRTISRAADRAIALYGSQQRKQATGV